MFERSATREIALTQARSHFDKDIAFRGWASSHGGVYVPVDDRTLPNPYLVDIPEREVTTPSGRVLTLMNPAYMLRQLGEGQIATTGASSRITSLEPVRPENAPDEWERSALERFEVGENEVSEFLTDGGEPRLRLMRPLRTAQACLACHSQHGYSVGDVRGGLSVTVPMSELLVRQQAHDGWHLVGYGTLWLAGIAGIAIGFGRVRSAARQYDSTRVALGESEQRYRALAENIPGAIYRCTVSHPWTAEFMSDYIEELAGFSADEFMDGTINYGELIHPEDVEKVKTRVEAAIQKRCSFALEYRIRHRDGSVRWVHEQGRASYQRETAVWIEGVILDVTPRRLAAERLETSEERYRSLAENTPDIITRFDSDLRHVFVNTAVKKFTDLKVEDIVGKTHRELGFSDELCCFFEDHIERVFLTGEFLETEFETTVGDKELAVFEWRLFPEIDQAGAVATVIAIARNVTAQRRVEQDYRTLFNTMLDGFALHEMIFDDSGRSVDYRFLAVNPAFERTTGLKAKDLIGKTVKEVLPSIETVWIERYGEVARTGESIHFREYSADLGRHYEVTAYRPAPGQFACVFEDVTEREHLEQQLRQAQKMEAVGLLAGGIAHDFNNVLAAVLGYSDLLRMRMKSEDPLQQYVTEIRAAAERAGNLTKKLLTFARRQPLNVQVVNPAKLLRGMEEMLRRVISENIELDINTSNDDLVISIDPGQLEQVIVNLVVNGRDAIQGKGRLSVSTAAISVEDDNLKATGLEAGDYLLLRVEDSGSGMPEEVKKHLFEPFFTTKEPGKGTGLGLAICFGIVTQAGGSISVESALGEGTTVLVWLPVAERKEVAAKPEEGEPQNLRGAERILLVEDDAAVRRLLSTVLSRYGYDVVTATNGQEAVQYALLDTKTIHAVVTDVVMPKMSGWEVVSQLRTVNPEIKAVFMSGYTGDALDKRSMEDDDFVLLSKPFPPIKLIASLRAILDADGS
jgi:PAS domain S-box-containing protein